MTFSTSLARLRVASLLLMLMFMPMPAFATPVDQAGWNARKQTQTLPNGITLAYVEMGDPEGSPVILLHGWTDTSRSFSLIAPHLAKNRLIILDQRGHGASSKPECCYSLANFAYDVTLFMDAKGIDRAAIVGHSLGSMVAQLLAADYPDRVTRLGLVGSTALAPIQRGDWLWTNVSALAQPIDANSDFIRAFGPAGNPTPVDPAFAAQVTAELVAVPLHVWRGVLRELTDVPVGRVAADIKAPALIIAGGKDELFGAAHQDALRKALPHAEYRVFAELGHNPIWEWHEAVGKTLAEFLAR